MTSASLYIQRLLEADALRQPLLRSVVQSLRLANGSRGLDAGCGIGLQAMLLAEAVGPEGHVNGLDIMPELLAFGNEQVMKAGYADRLTLDQGDLNCLPYADNSFDWAWSADCIGYPTGVLPPLLQELMRVVKPGGSIFLLAWSSQQLLPGYPLLEARLNAICSSYLPYLQGVQPEHNFLRANRAFHQAGLGEVKAQTFVGDIQAPLTDRERAALISLFEMLWGQRQPQVSEADWHEYQRLCEPGSPDFILDIPDYYAFFTYSVFSGSVQKKLAGCAV